MLTGEHYYVSPMIGTPDPVDGISYSPLVDEGVRSRGGLNKICWQDSDTQPAQCVVKVTDRNLPSAVPNPDVHEYCSAAGTYLSFDFEKAVRAALKYCSPTVAARINDQSFLQD